jgi:hypothetical protein
MKIYIDQSGKIEQTNRHTIVAFSNGVQKSLFISAKDKRELEAIFRQAGKPHIFVYKVFAICIYLVIQADLKKIRTIFIDREYPGQDSLIKKYILELIRHGGQSFDSDRILFTEIGKKSRAHAVAISAFREKKTANLQVKTKDVLKWVLK